MSCTTIGREAHRRLVEQQQARLRQQGPGDRQHLLLAAREVAGDAVDALFQAREEAEHAFEVAGHGRLVAPPVGTELEVLAHGECREDGAALGDVDEAALDDLVRRHPRDVFAVEADGAGPHRDEAGEREQGRRLARAVGADQRADLAGQDAEVDALQGLDVSVGDLQAGDLEERCTARGRGAHSSRPR